MSKARDLANIAGSNAFTAADETKLDGIETSADVTDADNVDPLVDAHLNSSTATSGEYLSWNGTDYDWASVPAGYADSDVDTHLNTSGATNGQYLGWNGSDYAWSTVDLSTKLDLSGGTMTGSINHGDNVKAQYGAGNDLQIYHDGSNSYISETGTGNLYIKTSDRFDVQSATGELMIRADANSNVKLNYDNSTKLTTTSTGIDVTGTINADGLSGITSVDATTATAIGNAGVGAGSWTSTSNTYTSSSYNLNTATVGPLDMSSLLNGIPSDAKHIAIWLQFEITAAPNSNTYFYWGNSDSYIRVGDSSSNYTQVNQFFDAYRNLNNSSSYQYYWAKQASLVILGGPGFTDITANSIGSDGGMIYSNVDSVAQFLSTNYTSSNDGSNATKASPYALNPQYLAWGHANWDDVGLGHSGQSSYSVRLNAKSAYFK